MPWVKLDDQFPDHPKVVQAGPMAGWLYVCGLAYCARQLTDGFIPAGQVPKLMGQRSAAPLAQRLVDAGLWEAITAGYRVHDYLEYNPTREQTLALRDKKATAGRRGGKQKASNVLAECQPSASAPVPVPQPVPHEASSQPERLPPEETARAPEPIERARALAVPKPGGPTRDRVAALASAFQEATGRQGPPTPSERGKWGPPLSELDRADVTPDEIGQLVVRYREEWSTPCTPQALANHLSQLRGQTARVAGKPKRESPLEQAQRRNAERHRQAAS